MDEVVKVRESILVTVQNALPGSKLSWLLDLDRVLIVFVRSSFFFVRFFFFVAPVVTKEVIVVVHHGTVGRAGITPHTLHSSLDRAILCFELQKVVRLKRIHNFKHVIMAVPAGHIVLYADVFDSVFQHVNLIIADRLDVDILQ